MRARTVTAGAVVTLLTAVGCAGGGSPGGPGTGPGTGGGSGTGAMGVVALAPFDACEDFLAYIRETAVDLVRPYGIDLHGEPAFGRGDAAMESGDGDLSGADGDDSGGRSADAPVEGEDYSGTNVQETGVDESDHVKTDGQRIFTARDGRLDIVDVTGGAPTLLSSVELESEWSTTMLLAGDRLLVLGETEQGARGTTEPGAGSSTSDYAWYGAGSQLELFDVSEPANPARISSLRMDGQVVSARMVDGVARVVLRSEPVGLSWADPEEFTRRDDAVSWTLAEGEAERANREVVLESSAEDWLPQYVHTDADGEATGSLVACDRVHRPDDFAGLGTTSVLTLDLDADLSPDSTVGVLSNSDTIYASTDRLYVTTNSWLDWEGMSEDEASEAHRGYNTALHAFDITGADTASYIGSGIVRGRVMDQWGMSEYQGVLRVATTEGSPWGWWWPEEDERAVSESFVTTFEESGGSLVELGQVGGLGKDERIYAVRFMGDVGYVVTFRETDPLYTVDLSDPSAPEVLGELKIMGYSAYLHPISDGLLLGVGQDADESGRTKGLQLSLFDVSDLSDPRRIHTETLADAHSEVEWSHLGFLYWPATGLAVVPFVSWERIDAIFTDRKVDDSPSSGALGYQLDAADGISEVGRVSHVGHITDEIPDTNAGIDALYNKLWQAQVSRSIVIGDSLYTISEIGIKASDLSTLADAGWLELPTVR